MKPIPWLNINRISPPPPKCSALFLDRDGTLIKWKEGYRSSLDDVEFIEDAKATINDIRHHFNYVVLVTNQSGIAKGLVTQEQVQKVNYAVERWLGFFFNRVYICPHLPDTCDCRKPKPGMFLNAIQDLYLDHSQCLMIGDSNEDIIAANSAGIPAIQVERG